MRRKLQIAGQLYRLWISRYEASWTPARWDDVPPRAWAIEPALEGTFDLKQADAFLEGFNRAMLDDPQRRWVVAVPVTVHYAGDLVAGAPFPSDGAPAVQCSAA